MSSPSSSSKPTASNTTQIIQDVSTPSIVQPGSESDDLLTIVRPYSLSPYPAWSLASLFLASSAITPSRFPTLNLPHISHRIGFSLIMTGAGYVINTGDVRNGSGIATAWTMTYLFWHARTSLFTRPLSRNPVSAALTIATAACSSLYGVEYFGLQP